MSKNGLQPNGLHPNEKVVSQTARQYEQVEQFMGPEGPRPEGRPVQEVEHRPPRYRTDH
jgi:hypothetical protein